MVSTSSGCRKLQMRFTKVKWSFTCLFLYHVKEVGDFSSNLKYLSCCAWSRGALCRALWGTWIWKVLFLPGSSSCSPARPVRCLREREAAQASPDRKHRFNQSCKPAVGFQVQGECFEILCKGFFPAGGIWHPAVLLPLILSPPWSLVGRAESQGE